MWFPQPRNQQYLTYYTIMESTHPLIAMSFSGPAHPLPVVRLVSEPIMSAETTMLGLFGLHPDAQRVVGESTQHAVSFPAWPIMTDPDNAHHALNLVAELEHIRRRPSLRRARTRINAVTAQLAASAPHFAPTFFGGSGSNFCHRGEPTSRTAIFRQSTSGGTCAWRCD